MSQSRSRGVSVSHQRSLGQARQCDPRVLEPGLPGYLVSHDVDWSEMRDWTAPSTTCARRQEFVAFLVLELPIRAALAQGLWVCP